MALAEHTVTLTTKVPGTDLPLNGTWSLSVHAIPPVLLDTDGHIVFAGVRRIDTQSGVATFDLPATDDPAARPVGFRWRLTFRSLDTKHTLGPFVFDLTDDVTLDDLVEATDIPVTPGVLTQTLAAAADAEEAKVAAVAAAAAAEAVGATTDTQIAGQIGDPDSATAAALRGAVDAAVETEDFTPTGAWDFSGATVSGIKATGVFNAANYGADPTGNADAAPAIQAAADAAQTYATAVSGRDALLVIPPGRYKLNSGVVVRTSLDARGVLCMYTPTTGTAFSLLADSGQTYVSRYAFLPRITGGDAQVAGGAIGVLLQNLSTSTVFVPWVQKFFRGIICQGVGTGFVHSDIHLGALAQNTKNMVLQPGVGGWVNQNTFHGGRFMGTPYTGTEDGNATHLQLVNANGSAPNNNTWIGASFEGNITAQYRVLVEGRYNQWINCRWENFGGHSRIRWGDTAQRNVVFGGYDSDTLTENTQPSAVNNKIVLPWTL